MKLIIFSLFIMSFTFISCEKSEQVIFEKNKEIREVKALNRELKERNLQLMKEYILLDSLKNELVKIQELNKNLERNSAEFSELRQELRMMLRFNNQKSSETGLEMNEDFQLFFDKFMQDSTFQLSRIDFPLTYIVEEFDNKLELDTLLLEKEDWEYQTFYLYIAKERSQIYDNFQGQLRANNQRMVHWFTTGEKKSSANYYFKGNDGIWMLEKIEKFD